MTRTAQAVTQRRVAQRSDRQRLLAAPGVKLLRTRKESGPTFVRTDLIRCTGRREGRRVQCYVVVEETSRGDLVASNDLICKREALRLFEQGGSDLAPDSIAALLEQLHAR